MRIAALILTLDEECHIERCIDRISPFVDEVLVVDSGSRDNTISITEARGVRVVMRPFESYGSQVNFGLDELWDFDWVMRIDADEYLDPKVSVDQFRARLRNSLGVEDSLTVERRFIFEGKLLRWGSVGRQRVVRIVSPKSVRCDLRLMDEKFLNGELGCGNTSISIIDENLKGLDEWFVKHLRYSLLEFEAAKSRRGVNNKYRWIYYSLPLFWRCFAYFAYRYFWCLGFLDGRAGFLFHFFQCLWYRMLVDARLSKRSLSSDRGQ